jgi:hypothetical protein
MIAPITEDKTGVELPRPVIPDLKDGASNPFERKEVLGLLDPHSIHKKEFTFPGYNGIPFRGSPPLLKEDDPPEKQPQLGMQLFVTVLELNKPDDLEYYQRICQLVGNGVAQISFEDKQWDAGLSNWKVLIRWMLYYYYMTNAIQSEVPNG